MYINLYKFLLYVFRILQTNFYTSSPTQEIEIFLIRCFASFISYIVGISDFQSVRDQIYFVEYYLTSLI